MSEKTFYSSQLFKSLAEAMISPFLSVYLLFLGATKTLIGLASTLPTLANLFFQLFWSSFSESSPKKKFFIIFGGLVWAFMWIPIAFVKEPPLLIFLLTIQSLFSAASVPTWTTLLIRTTPSYRIAYTQGNLNIIGKFASLVGNLIAGLILNTFGFVPFIFYIIAFFGVMSKLPFFLLKEPVLPYSDGRLKIILKRTFDFSRIKKEKDLGKLIIAITFLNFSVSLSSPFLSVYVITGLGGSIINITMLLVIEAIVMIIFSRPWGSVINKTGKKFVMLGCILPISLIPSIYALAPAVEFIYLYQILGVMSWTGFNLAVFAYLASVLPKEKADSLVGFYNLFVGLGSATGPVVGGILSEFIGFKSLFFLSTFLRFLTIFLIERLEEKGTAPKLSSSAYESFGFGYRIENMVEAYSLVLVEALKQSTNLFKKKPSLSLHRGSRLLRRR
ncbi:MAG: MFS transporter [Candidatus Aenigmatarchaeota archaeon]